MADVVLIDQLFAVSFPGERLGAHRCRRYGPRGSQGRSRLSRATCRWLQWVQYSLEPSHTRHLFHIFEAPEYDAPLDKRVAASTVTRAT